MSPDQWNIVNAKLSRLRVLAARTDNIDEARNAAYAMVRLIIEHDLTVLDAEVAAHTIAQKVMAIPDLGPSRGTTTGRGVTRGRCRR